MIIEKKSIPKDWDIIPVEDCFDILDNQRKPLNESERNLMKGDIPYYGANGVVDYVSEYLFDDDLILIAEDGGYFDEFQTRPIAYRVKGKAWINNHAHVLKAKNGYYQDYLFYCLEHKNILIWLNGGTRAKLNKGDLEKLPIQIAPVSEQIAIAQMLSTADAAIHTTEKLIAQKELRKKWLMQQLLTGKKRLKGFDNTKWKIQPLENFIKPIVREVPKPDVPYLGIGLRSHGKGTFLKYDEQPEKNSMDKFYVVRPKDLIVNITFAWEQAIAIVGPEDDGALASHRFPTYTFIEEKGHPDFFRFFILQPRMKFMLEMISPGGAGRNRVMSKSDFIKLEFLLPEYKEQTAIAQVLQAADKEISLLKAKVEKLREQKKGLMQVLLTGKVRLKINNE